MLLQEMEASHGRNRKIEMLDVAQVVKLIRDEDAIAQQTSAPMSRWNRNCVDEQFGESQASEEERTQQFSPEEQADFTGLRTQWIHPVFGYPPSENTIDHATWTTHQQVFHLDGMSEKEVWSELYVAVSAPRKWLDEDTKVHGPGDHNMEENELLIYETATLKLLFSALDKNPVSNIFRKWHQQLYLNNIVDMHKVSDYYCAAFSFDLITLIFILYFIIFHIIFDFYYCCYVIRNPRNENYQMHMYMNTVK